MISLLDEEKIASVDDLHKQLCEERIGLWCRQSAIVPPSGRLILEVAPVERSA